MKRKKADTETRRKGDGAKKNRFVTVSPRHRVTASFFFPVAVSVFLFFGAVLPVFADYTQELQDQIEELKKDYPQPRPEYFHDAGILAHKADDAGLYEQATGIVRAHLFMKAEEYVRNEWQEINRLYTAADSFNATRRLQDLVRPVSYYKPSEEYLKTASAQAVTTELVQLRTQALEALERGCLDHGLLAGILAIRESGFFEAGTPAEIEAMRLLNERLSCCLSWNAEIRLSKKQPFETEYEAGEISEEANLRLESSRTDLSFARWAGEFIYRFTGRDGQGQGVSQGILTYRKGQDQASLVITASRVTSTGRMNFPNAFSGENRTLGVRGNPVNARLAFFEDLVPMTGCRIVENEKK